MSYPSTVGNKDCTYQQGVGAKGIGMISLLGAEAEVYAELWDLRGWNCRLYNGELEPDVDGSVPYNRRGQAVLST